MTLHNFLKWNGLVFAAAYAFESALGEIQVFQLIQMLEDGLARVKALGAPRSAGEFLKPFFDRLGKPDR